MRVAHAERQQPPRLRDRGGRESFFCEVDATAPGKTVKAMELHLSPELKGQLALAADRRGVSVEVLARVALERAVDYHDWFIHEVEAGLAQINSGQVLTHDAVEKRLATKLARSAVEAPRHSALATCRERPVLDR